MNAQLNPDRLAVHERVMVANPESTFYGRLGRVERRVDDRTYAVHLGPVFESPTLVFGRDELVIAPSGSGR